MTQPDLLLPAIVEKELGYGLRSDVIDGVDYPLDYFVCIRGRTSMGDLRPWKPNQCHPIVLGSAPTEPSPSVQHSTATSSLVITRSFKFLYVVSIIIFYIRYDLC